MSCGERSCKWLYHITRPCKNEAGQAMCNVTCPWYESNGKEPDSTPAKPFTKEKFDRMLTKIMNGIHKGDNK